MTAHAIYRFCIWLPIIVPVVLFASGFGSARGPWLFEAIGWSFWAGGIPYAALAFWATRWIRGRSEREVLTLMAVAPIVFVAVWFLFALAYATLFLDRGTWMNLVLLGAGIALPLGYFYVALTLILRVTLGPRPLKTSS